MKFLSSLSSPHVQRLLVLSLLGLPLGFACSSDDAAPETPVTYSISIAKLDGQELGSASVPLHCDGTLAVEVELGSNPSDYPFILRPSRACGASPRCGYVRIQALSSSGEELAHVDTATTAGVLSSKRLNEVVSLRAQLLRGIDDEPVLNPDQSEVTASATPTFQVLDNCPSQGMGGAGNSGGGAGPSEGGAGGAAPQPTGGAPGAAGGDNAAGASPMPPLGGAGGDAGAGGAQG